MDCTSESREKISAGTGHARSPEQNDYVSKRRANIGLRDATQEALAALDKASRRRDESRDAMALGCRPHAEAVLGASDRL